MREPTAPEPYWDIIATNEGVVRLQGYRLRREHVWERSHAVHLRMLHHPFHTRTIALKASMPSSRRGRRMRAKFLHSNQRLTRPADPWSSKTQPKVETAGVW